MKKDITQKNKILQEVVKAENDGFGDVSEFDEPWQVRMEQHLKDQPTYVDAWILFNNIEKDSVLRKASEQIIPRGNGAFED